MRALNKTRQKVLATSLLEAKSLPERLWGLIPRRNLNPGEGLWIPLCNSIHTLFMRFELDILFVDKNLRVVDRREKLRPWKLILPVWRAYGVLELPAGTIASTETQIGDELDVGPALS